MLETETGNDHQTNPQPRWGRGHLSARGCELTALLPPRLPHPTLPKLPLLAEVWTWRPGLSRWGARHLTGRKGRGRAAATLPGRLATAPRGAMEARSSRELKARNYLEKHRIMELLTYLTSALIFFRPGKCLASVLPTTRLSVPHRAVPRNFSSSHPSTRASRGWRTASLPDTSSPIPPQTLFQASRLVEPSCCPLTLWLSMKQDLTRRHLCACLLPSVAGLGPVRVVAGGREAPGFGNLAPGPVP